MKPFLIGVGIVVVLGCLGCAGLFAIGLIASPRTGTTSSASRTPTPLAPQVSTTATEIFRAYRANEVAADATYKDKIVSLTGSVVDIRRSFGETTVTLRGGDSDFETISLILADGQDTRAAQLQRGTPISATGRCVGVLLVDPAISDAVIQ